MKVDPLYIFFLQEKYHVNQLLEKAGLSTGPRKKPSQRNDKKDIEVQTEGNIAYPTMSLYEENTEALCPESRPAVVSHQTEVHSELRSRVSSHHDASSDVITENANVLSNNNEHLHFASPPLPRPLPSGYKPSFPVMDCPTSSTSLA